MNAVLVDTSVWVSFFRGEPAVRPLAALLEYNQACVNDLILAELLPSLAVRKERRLAELIRSVERLPLRVDWEDVIAIQTNNLKQGLNKVGISDIIILQNAVQNGAALYSLDRHFPMMQKRSGVALFEE